MCQHDDSLFIRFISSQAHFLGCDGDLCMPLINYVQLSSGLLSDALKRLENSHSIWVIYCQASISARTSTQIRQHWPCKLIGARRTVMEMGKKSFP